MFEPKRKKEQKSFRIDETAVKNLENMSKAIDVSQATILEELINALYHVHTAETEKGGTRHITLLQELATSYIRRLQVCRSETRLRNIK